MKRIILVFILLTLSHSAVAYIFYNGFEEGVFLNVDGATFQCLGDVKYDPFQEPKTIYCRTFP